jgi:Ca2+-binding EF-hand superfamily protein
MYNRAQKERASLCQRIFAKQNKYYALKPKAFNMFDQDRDGIIGLEDLKDVYATLG